MNSFLACNSSILTGVQMAGCGFLGGFNPLALFLCIHPTPYPAIQHLGQAPGQQKRLLLIETSLPPEILYCKYIMKFHL